MASREEIERIHQGMFVQFNAVLLVLGAAVALGVGIASYVHGIKLVWCVLLGLASFGMNALATIAAYKFTVGRGAPASMAGAAFLVWAVLGGGAMALITMLLLGVTGQ